MTDKTLGGYIHTSPDPADMDGGVAAALIEKEADTRTREHLLAEEERLRELEESLRAHLSRTINRAEKAEASSDIWRKYAQERTATLKEQAALIEALRAEVNEMWPLRRRAEKAEKERDEAREHLRARTVDVVDAIEDRDKARRERAQAMHVMRQSLGARATQPRGFTADDITDELVERAWAEWVSLDDRDAHSMRLALRAALTEPARHPEAERLAPIIDAAIRGHSDITDPTVVHAIADALAEEGVRGPEMSHLEVTDEHDEWCDDTSSPRICSECASYGAQDGGAA